MLLVSCCHCTRVEVIWGFIIQADRMLITWICRVLDVKAGDSMTQREHQSGKSGGLWSHGGRLSHPPGSGYVGSVKAIYGWIKPTGYKAAWEWESTDIRHEGSLVVSSFSTCTSDKPREGERLRANGHPPGKRDPRINEKGHLSSGLSSFISISAQTGQGVVLTTTGLLVTVLSSFMQFDTSQSHLSRGTSVEKMSHQIGLWADLWGIFLTNN